MEGTGRRDDPIRGQFGGISARAGDGLRESAQAVGDGLRESAQAARDVAITDRAVAPSAESGGAITELGAPGEMRTVDIDLVELEADEQRESAPRAVPDRTAPSVDDVLEVISYDRHAQRRLYDAATRVVDVVLAAALLVFALPVIAVLAILVKLDSRGPAVFRQTRVGKDAQLFTFYKFRTMYVDARERFPELYAYEYEQHELETMFFKLASDPRCTRVGRWLRRTSLDELPNVLNVLKGDMGIVGPRPEIPQMLPHYKPEQLAKFTVKPGLTGLAQISGRNLLTFQETIERDLEYVAKRSTRLDLYVLVRTPIVVVQMIGAL